MEVAMIKGNKKKKGKKDREENAAGLIA